MSGSMPILMALTCRSSSTASNCDATTSVGTLMAERTPMVFCEVSDVMTVAA